jgi:precorrin-6B methylase 2
MNIKITKEFKINDLYEPKWFENIFNEIWFDHEYSRYGVEVEKDDIVIDCGANVGFFTLYALNKGAKHVYSIECELENFNSLKENVIGKNVTTYHGFAGYENENYSINRILVENNLNHIDFIKVDIEHGEYPFILNTSDDDIKKVNKWVIELHNIYELQYDIYRILEKFTKNCFDLKFEQPHKGTNIALLYAKKNIK